MKPALVILDAQNDFFGEDNPNRAGFLKTVPVINKAIANFHARGWPVIFVQHVSSAKPRGSGNWEIYPGFDCCPEDLRIDKSGSSAFAGTELRALLEERAVDTLLLVGYLTERCVLQTCQSALGYGFKVRILPGGTANLKVDPLPKVV